MVPITTDIIMKEKKREKRIKESDNHVVRHIRKNTKSHIHNEE